MDKDEERRLRAIAPDITRVTIDLLRTVVGLEPAERVPEEALRAADAVLAKYGSDGLRVLIMSMAGWTAVGIESNAHLTGKTHEAYLDEMELTCWEANPDG
ncbi:MULTISPECIES: hypothetical protein [unclassified Streptomyces]|uniref:Uncharacterized protein n=1 Tax=Streptomyces sp. NBC_00060 TaxID=2975636 RepID=A0AAU2H9V1_9ACTN